MSKPAINKGQLSEHISSYWCIQHMTAAQVLIVQEVESSRRALSLILRELGFTVTEASSSLNALAELRQGLRPNAILADLIMSAMDGITFREYLLLDPDIASIPTILMAVIDIESLIHDFPHLTESTILIPKPIQLDVLLRILRLCIYAQRANLASP